MLQLLARRRRPRKINVYEQLHKDAGLHSQKIQQKRHQRDQDTLKVQYHMSYMSPHQIAKLLLAAVTAICASVDISIDRIIGTSWSSLSIYKNIKHTTIAAVYVKSLYRISALYRI